MNRRQFLYSSGLVCLSGPEVFAAGQQSTAFQQDLPIPELIDTRARGGILSLVAAPSQHRFAPDMTYVSTFGFSAPYLGPVVRVHHGDSVDVTVKNRLGVPTTSHWHGLLVPAAQDNGPHHGIAPGQDWASTLKIDQPETTAWYHAHPHQDTGRQVYRGLAGMMIVVDGSGKQLGLPDNYGIDDIPLILQDRLFNQSGGMSYLNTGPARATGMRGETLIVNGAIAPRAQVPVGLARLRILNAANARTFDLNFADGRSFHVIASDGGYLPAPVEMKRLLIVPGERFEVLVDFSDGGAVVLETARDPAGDIAGMGGPRGVPGVPSSPGPLLRFVPTAAIRLPASQLPETLAPSEARDPAAAVERRNISLDMVQRSGGDGNHQMGDTSTRGVGPLMGINGRSFDRHRIDFAVKLGTSEIWTVTGHRMPHPFHIHGAFFRVLSMDGGPPPPHLAGDKDTVMVDGRAEILVRFAQPATREWPFMFHCHILEHEDAGMMAQYLTT